MRRAKGIVKWLVDVIDEKRDRGAGDDLCDGEEARAPMNSPLWGDRLSIDRSGHPASRSGNIE